jgi:hypothetical protein
MSKVYIVRGYDEYEGYSDLAVYADKTYAERHLNDLKTCKAKYSKAKYNEAMEASDYFGNENSIKWKTRIELIGGNADAFYIKEIETRHEYKCPWGK